MVRHATWSLFQYWIQIERVDFDIDPGSTPEVNEEPSAIENMPIEQLSLEELGIVDDDKEEQEDQEDKIDVAEDVVFDAVATEEEEECPKLDLSELSARSAPDGEAIEVKYNEITTPLKAWINNTANVQCISLI